MNLNNYEKGHGKTVLNLRYKLGLSRRQLGLWLCKNWQTIRRYEQGERIPKLTLIKIRKIDIFFDEIFKDK